MNGVSLCIEEIALEGLDGITISTWWRRIKSASATLWSTVDENYKEFLWRCVTSCEDIQAYLLEQPRAEIEDFVLKDSEIYPYCCINESGIRGSCSTFKSRKLVNISGLSLQNAVGKYGNRLVLVASQLLRHKVLFGAEFDASVNMTDPCYCLMEIIGRARKLGRLHCHLGLQTSVDSKTLFYQVKTLLKLQLITKQSVLSMKTVSSIIYLARYHTEHVHDSIQFKISEALIQAPECRLPLEDLCSKLQETNAIVEKAVEALTKSGHVRYVVDSHDSPVDMIGTQESGEQKVVQFVYHFHNLCVDGDNEIEDEEWTQPEHQDLSISIPAEIPIMHAIYQFVESKGKDGASLTQCCQELKLPYFIVRRLLTDLETFQVLVCKFEDMKNTRKNQYFARSVLVENEFDSHVCAISLPCASEVTQSSTSDITFPTTRPYITHPSTSQPTQSLTIQSVCLPNLQTTQLQMSQITTPPTLQVSQPPSAHIPQPPATQPSTSQIIVHCNVVPSLTNLEATVEENVIADTQELPTNASVNRTTAPTQKPVSSHSQKMNNTEKFCRRKDVILSVLKNLKVVEGHLMFKKVIREEEKKMGIDVNIDRRSVLYILKKLASDGLLKIIKVVVKVEDEEQEVEFFCQQNVKEDDEEIVFGVRRFKDGIVVEKARRNGVFAEQTPSDNVFLPKMVRCELLHVFLFYVIYELSNPNADLEAWKRKYDWAQHLRPEHAPKTLGKGWFTPYSVLLLLPVSLYCKLVGTTFQNNIIQEYFADPATKHMLLKDLPPVARQLLVGKRKDNFLFGSFEILACFGLITPTTRQLFFHTRDIACYLHTSTVLKDTRDSQPAYDVAMHPEGKNFPEKTFSFSGLADVEQYWSNARVFCLTTPLNKTTLKNTVKSPFKSDFESFIVNEKEVPTHSKPRGDGLGAAGFDSRLYCHLLPKWKLTLVKDTREVDSDVEESLDWQLCFTNDDVLSKTINVASERKKVKRKHEQPARDKPAKKKRKAVSSDVQRPEACEQGVNSSEKKANANKTVLNIDGKKIDGGCCSSTQQDNSSNLPNNVGKVKKRKRKKRKRKEPKAKPHGPKGHWCKNIHDKRDEDALKQMHAQRNTFTPQQKKLLFICCLALRILGKRSTDTGYSDWLWTRDILYKDNYESAKTKTALSISRKYRSMMGNAQTRTNLNICVADCMQEKEFQPYCNLGKSCTEVMFNELVELLKMKYSMESMVSRPLVLPFTMHEFLQQKNLYSSLEVERPDKCDEEILSLEPHEASLADVRQRIIRDSIVSALLLKNVKYEPHVAFKFLSQFTEEELIIAVSVLKNKRIVVRKELRYMKGLDLASCSFSQMLSSVSHRTIENHCSSSIVDDAKSFYDEIQNRNSRTSVLVEDDESPERSLALKFFESSILGGQVYCILSLLTCERLAVNMEVPENFLTLEKSQNHETLKIVPENSNGKPRKEISDKALEIKESSSSSVPNTSSSDHPCAIGEIGEGEPSEARRPETVAITEENTSGSVGDMHKSLDTMDGVKPAREKTRVTRTRAEEESPESPRTQTTSQGTTVQAKDISDVFPQESREMMLGNVNRKRCNDMVLDVLCGIEDHLFGCVDMELNTPLYKVKLQPTPTFTCTMTTSDVDCVRASSNNHVVTQSIPNNDMYESYLDKIATYHRTGEVNRIQFSVNPCMVDIRLLSVPENVSIPEASSLAQCVAHHFKTNGLRMPTTIEGCINVCSKMFGYGNKDCQALKAVYEVINSSKEVGMSASNVSKLVRRVHSLVDFSTDGLIKVLEAFNLVCQVGFVEARYVTKSFKEHWFVTFPGNQVISLSEKPKKQARSKKRKRSIGEEPMHDGKCTKLRVAEELKEPENGPFNGEATSDTTPTAMPRQRRRTETKASPTSSTVDEQNSKKTTSNNSDVVSCSGSEEEEKSGKSSQTSAETQTESCPRTLSRPWITMTGEINKNAFNTFHRSVLAYIIKYPGVQKYSIVKHFVNLVFPVAIDEVLRKLEDSQCIEKRVCYVKETTLFSSKPGSKVTYYLPKPDAMFKLTRHVFV